jgi:hypothetical protein
VILVVEALTTIGNTNKGLNSSIACDGYDNYKIPPIAGKVKAAPFISSSPKAG